MRRVKHNYEKSIKPVPVEEEPVVSLLQPASIRSQHQAVVFDVIERALVSNLNRQQL
jgi:hypothetical protein